jgi:hypothetical protein
VVGRGVAEGMVELVERVSQSREDLPASELLARLMPRILNQRQGLRAAWP